MGAEQKIVEVVKISPPPVEQRVMRNADFPSEGAKKGRYDLPASIDSPSPVGFRTRVSMTAEEAEVGLRLLSLERPKAFVKDAAPPTEQQLFEEVSLGVLTARQSTNYKGHRDLILGPADSRLAADILRQLQDAEAPVLDHATHTHIILSRPYRTPFTMLLTFIGHKPVVSLATVAIRGLRKKFQHIDDIPTIGYLQQLHIGILADQIERATVVASGGRQKAQVLMRPFSGEHAKKNRDVIRKLEELIGLSAEDRAAGWRVAIAAQIGEVKAAERLKISHETCRKLGANMMAFRSERIQPGVNQEEKAPAQYQTRQDMDVPDELTVMAGRAGYNAFVHWTDVDREFAKELLMLERIDVMTPNGKERLRDVRDHLNAVTDKVVKNLPLWADLPTGRAFSRNAARGKKAFALAGQRIYMGGLDRAAIDRAKIDWTHAVRAFGAASARGALVAELMGVVDLPDDCDLLAGICLMAGPVNQNDIGKEFYGEKDLLASAFPGKNPTSLLFWTLKAKTIADPIGNEEQLMNAAQKGALVDLRPGPHEVAFLRRDGRMEPMRKRDGRINAERAFADVDNFVTSPDGREIPGNRGSAWPEAWRNEVPW
ncbi:MAG: hypothetical protein R3E66_12485 [bacterium]